MHRHAPPPGGDDGRTCLGGLRGCVDLIGMYSLMLHWSPPPNAASTVAKKQAFCNHLRILAAFAVQFFCSSLSPDENIIFFQYSAQQPKNCSAMPKA
jgi:hypothetical protein